MVAPRSRFGLLLSGGLKEAPGLLLRSMSGLLLSGGLWEAPGL